MTDTNASRTRRNRPSAVDVGRLAYYASKGDREAQAELRRLREDELADTTPDDA